MPVIYRSRSDVGYGSRGSSIRKSFSGSPRKSVQADHVRSPRLNSRLEWKRRMREQFLPAEYVQDCERMDACINPLYVVHHAQNIPEESSEALDGASLQQGMPGPSRGMDPSPQPASTLSSCDTMVVYDDEMSNDSLNIHPSDNTDNVINTISDDAIENAFAVKELNRAAMSRGILAHAAHGASPTSPALGNDNNSDSSNNDIYHDADSDLQIFMTNESGSSASDEPYTSSPEPEFLSVATSPIGSEATSLCNVDASNNGISNPKQSYSNVFF